MKSLLIFALVSGLAVATATAVPKAHEVEEEEKWALQMPSVPANDDMELAKNALEATREFIEIFNSEIFGEEVKKVAEIISKIFGLVISILNLVGGIIGQESPELIFMRKQFKEVHAKLDGIDMKLDEVKNLIEWQTTRGMYAQYESSIRATSHLLDNYVAAPAGSRDVYKRQFLTAFQHNPLAALKLYQAIVETDFVVSSNLAAAVVHYTQQHRRKVTSFLLAMQRIIMRGAQMEIAYEKMVHGDHAAHVTKQAWDIRMEKLFLRIQQVEIDVKNNYHRQLELEFDSFLNNYRHLSHRDFSARMYNYLVDKYDWRYWFSLAYKNVAGGNLHWIWLCGGTSRFRTYGDRNVAVASVDPKYTSYTLQKGIQALDAAQQDGHGSNAELWTKHILSKIGESCWNVAFVGSVCTDCENWFMARGDRATYRVMNNRGRMTTFVFG